MDVIYFMFVYAYYVPTVVHIRNILMYRHHNNLVYVTTGKNATSIIQYANKHFILHTTHITYYISMKTSLSRSLYQ